MVVARDERDVRGQRVERRWISQASRISLLGRAEAGVRRVRLIHDGVDHLRTVDRQQVGGAGALIVNVADAPSAAEHGLRHQRVRQSKPRSEVVAIGIDERAIADRSVLGEQHRARRRIEVREHVARFPHRRRVFVPQAEVHRQLVVQPHIVLQVGEMHLPANLRDQRIAQRVLRAQAEHEVGEVVDVVRRRACGTRELTGVAVAAVQRVDVHHFDVDLLELVSRLQRLPSHRPGVVQLRVPHRRVLPLRVRRLATEIRVTRNQLCGQAAADARIGRQARDPEGVERARRSKRRRIFSALRVRPAEADLEQ